MLRPVVIAALIALAAIACGIALGEPIDWSRALTDSQSIDYAILVHARLPRVLLGVFVGAGLSVTGGAYQGLLRNPLAEPYVLGVSGGAALGATVAIALVGSLSSATLMVSVAALAAAGGGGLATLIVWLLAARTSTGREAHATSILLAGVVVNAIAAGAITFVKTVVKAATAQQLLFWLAGFLDVPTTSSLVLVAVCVLGGSAFLVAEAPRLNLLALGEEHAAHLGVDVQQLERRIFLASSIVVGAVVATSGMIGFIGLLVPHLVRRMPGGRGVDHRVLLPTSFLLGAGALVACDVASRLTFRLLGTEPPVGAITALVGGPVFLVLLSRRGDRV